MVDAESATQTGKTYAEESGVNKIMQDLLQKVIREKPDDPVSFLLDVLTECKLRKGS